jgi:iron complex transport system substrate-binding protein
MKIGELAARDPEVIMVSPCGFPMERSRRELPALSGNPHWNGLRAVRDHKVLLADGNHYFNRPGPRIVESPEILVEILHSELFRFGHGA